MSDNELPSLESNVEPTPVLQRIQHHPIYLTLRDFQEIVALLLFYLVPLGPGLFRHPDLRVRYALAPIPALVAAQSPAASPAPKSTPEAKMSSDADRALSAAYLLTLSIENLRDATVERIDLRLNGVTAVKGIAAESNSTRFDATRLRTWALEPSTRQVRFPEFKELPASSRTTILIFGDFTMATFGSTADLGAEGARVDIRRLAEAGVLATFVERNSPALLLILTVLLTWMGLERRHRRLRQ